MEERIAAYEKDFREHLLREEKSAATVEKYLRDMRAFCVYGKDAPLTKELVLSWKQQLQEGGYAVRSINSMLASVNSFLSFLGRGDCRVKTLRQQRAVYCRAEKELSKEEYMRLLKASTGRQINLIMQTICSTGIRVSELQHFTVEQVQRGEIQVNCKGKLRSILLPGQLRRRLLSYAERKNITGGPIFLNRKGEPLDRSSIWAQMKRLCLLAGVAAGKVFPHNLRKLFAKTFYRMEKDIAKLADILGHGSIETTRIYIMTSGFEHRRKMERLGLLI